MSRTALPSTKYFPIRLHKRSFAHIKFWDYKPKTNEIHLRDDSGVFISLNGLRDLSDLWYLITRLKDNKHISAEGFRELVEILSFLEP